MNDRSGTMLWARSVTFRTLPLLLLGVVACSEASPPGTGSGTEPSGESDESAGDGSGDESSAPASSDASTRKDASSSTGTASKDAGALKPGTTKPADASVKDDAATGTTGPT